MHFSKPIVACGVAAINAANNLVAAAPIKGADLSTSIALPTDLKGEIESTASSADSANIQGQFEDSGIIDDIERLLDIIGNHVDRMRGEGGASFEAKGFKLKDLYDSDNNDKDSHQNKPVHAKELEHKGAASPAPAGDNAESSAIEPATEEEPSFPPFQGAPGPSIFDPPAGGDNNEFPNSFEDGGNNNHQQQEEPSHPAHPPAFPEIGEPAGDSGFTNITCKGISVCNPVTVFHEKGADKKGKGKGWGSWGNWGSWGKTTAGAAEAETGEDAAATVPAEEQQEQQQ
ncbi:hypothetical protein C8A05DRAFT_29179 [Staphylotrichum tortipilum]|uniref:Uncharacterized protein n=1 Tax=Staphylotrichum tortipilum TaxID=2831512 RepID=A0AAN6MTR6_9PEZI|nr:hypothetical protein C8A05DRAFT_29179 [Staphylotrichum longicolle]